MGIIKRGILGGFSGKVANIVGSSWKGIAVMKSLPLSVANPRTTAQVEQRTKFSNVVAFSKEILTTVIKPLWDRFAQQQSGFNAFISTNIDLFDDEIPDPAADLIISQGKMEQTSITNITVTIPEVNILVEWDTAVSGLKLASDIPYIVFVNGTSGEVRGFDLTGAATRNDGSTELNLQGFFSTGDTGNFYLAFKREDGTVVSNTFWDSGTI